MAQVVDGSSSMVAATATDASGNVYLAGSFSGTASFGATVLSSAGATDVFVAKWSPATSSFVWAQRAGGTGPDRATGLAVSAAGLYLSGSFGGAAADFGSSRLLPLSSTGNGFVAKLTQAGSGAAWSWAQQLGGSSYGESAAIGLQGAALYVAGVFRGTAHFGSSTFTSSTAPNGSAATDMFVVRLSEAGSGPRVEWAQRADGVGWPTALAVEGRSVYLTGGFAGQASFGSTTLQSVPPWALSQPLHDLFVAKLSDAGTGGSWAWAFRSGGSSTDWGTAVVASGGSVYVAGTFESVQVDAGSRVLLNPRPTPQGTALPDGLLLKLTDAGTACTVSWALETGGENNIAAMSPSSGGLYLGGSFQGATARFGSSTLQQSAGPLFVARLVDTGNTGTFVWAQQAGSSSSSQLQALSVAGPVIYAAGRVMTPARFGSLSAGAAGGTAPVGFLASLQDLALATAGPAGAARLQLVPNPARGRVVVALPPGAVALKLVDALGRTHRTQALRPATAEAEISLAGLVPGLYLVRVQAGGQTLSQRLLVE
ncbi:hypothetical protein GCM10023185_11510 [Hymenobacter saemangeumensis]|uniref:T9SS type A sorting domain-containing protein n=2 Tax=Hymenobacter saemangeumensis TaxID=1084522 RepID=A0ABP8I5Z0_9BACT